MFAMLACESIIQFPSLALINVISCYIRRVLIQSKIKRRRDSNEMRAGLERTVIEFVVLMSKVWHNISCAHTRFSIAFHKLMYVSLLSRFTLHFTMFCVYLRGYSEFSFAITRSFSTRTNLLEHAD